MSHPSPPTTHRRRVSRRTKVITASVTAVAVGGIALLLPASAHAAAVSAEFSKSSTWETGYTGVYEISNAAGGEHAGWKLEFDLPDDTTIDSLWNGKHTVNGRHVVVTPESWNEKIQPGQKLTIGFSAEHGKGANSTPSNCLINGEQCSPTTQPPGRPSPSTSPSAPASPSSPPGGQDPSTGPTPPTTPPPGTGTSAPFAPYVDTQLYPPFDLSATAKATGAKEFNLAFVVSAGGSCTPKWGGVTDLNGNPVTQQIGAFRTAGGDVRVSFGGANGMELGQACTSATALADAYQKVIDSYALTKVDFDIEGGAIADQASNTRRAQAIGILQKKAADKGKELDISLTLPVTTEGLDHNGQEFLKNAKGNGLTNATVNIMAMDYGPAYTGNMGDYAISAAKGTQATLKSLFGLTDAQAWKRLVVTPMIGQNDVQGEVFTLADAEKLVEFAKEKHLGGLSVWSGTRDKQCPQGQTQWADATCSSILQQPLAFSKEFAKYTG